MIKVFFVSGVKSTCYCSVKRSGLSQYSDALVACFHRSLGSDVVVVHRQEFDEDLIAKSSVIISVGGDGTFLQAASIIGGNEKPLIGVNSDTTKSLGFLCLSKSFTEDIDEGLEKLIAGNYEWLYRKRIRYAM